MSLVCIKFYSCRSAIYLYCAFITVQSTIRKQLQIHESCNAGSSNRESVEEETSVSTVQPSLTGRKLLT